MKKMNKTMLAMSLITVLLSGCAETTLADYVPARQTTIRPHYLAAPSRSHYQLRVGNDPALNSAFNQYLKTGTAPNIITSGFIKFAYNAGQQPIIQTTPFQETVISLEPGERFTNITSGDPNRWSYAVAVSGQGPTQQQNVLVKPSLPNISTNMVITTDRRLYNLRLVSQLSAAPSRNVSFWYPDELIAAANSATFSQANSGIVDSVPDVNLNQLNFNYSVSNGGWRASYTSWRPIRVFDDGQHTYIQFPGDLVNRDMPALFISNGFISNGGTKELVNYRSKPPYFVVDKIFKQAVLVMGVGSSQSKIIITNNHYS
jgi:P-type conjugative transfer protein TrbG